ncbi:sulfite reductase subunit alpha [Variovorax sp. OV329]|uniref:sulfite reductase subunit alpha n=1 Tax=Variovorax sp. OV329 TaxID=1882825 RepID=UPI0008EB0D8D|nr:sulfite reductase subunit alpha [Variovorax sp. OV329]SFM54578.1 sulfite reductase (NADPH) flavoprotein alpha-component [Variovorax sp. OV329]
MSELAWRAAGAAATLLAYAGLCVGTFRRESRRAAQTAERAAALAGTGERAPTLVLYGSQTGQAEALAWQTAGWLKAQGEPVRVCSLNEITSPELQSAQRALFVASTYGEGDAPDGASVFDERVMSTAASLPDLRFSVLALGDRQYTHFCGFGRRLDAWLRSTGAKQENECLEADNADTAALDTWRHRIGGQRATSQADDAAIAWRLLAREQLNPSSQGAPLFHVALVPAQGELPEWQAGDLVQLTVPGDPARPRDYSIASIPQDGELQLLVRQERHPDGRLGAASGLLTQTLPVGGSLPMRIRPHTNFRLGDNAQRPLILVGNGSGLAGLRAHLRERARQGRHDNWLLYGERHSQWDRPCHAELARWERDGVLERLELVFSRDQPERRYVQHQLLQASEELMAWLARGAALYVCGSLQGMGSGVDAALRQIAGDAAVAELNAQGRYRRDVY